MLIFETARDCYTQLCKLPSSNNELVALQRDLFHTAIRYARLRATWLLVDHQARMDMNSERTAAHNTFIDSCNILSRCMADNNLDTSWRASLGDDRKIIGDFACYLTALLGWMLDKQS